MTSNPKRKFVTNLTKSNVGLANVAYMDSSRYSLARLKFLREPLRRNTLGHSEIQTQDCVF